MSDHNETRDSMRDTQVGHVCEPTRWPIDASERWVCPECGERYAAAYSTGLGQFGWVAGVSR